MLVEILLVLVLASLWFGFYQILKQQGRILLRLDALEQTRAPDAAPRGLAVGAEFPDFTLPDLDNRPVSLRDFRGRPVLLVHWSAACGFCELIAPDLANLQHEFQSAGAQLLLLADADAEANRKLAAEHGLECPILPCGEGRIPEPFSTLGTPSAYLLDAGGRVAKPLAVGGDEVPALAEEAVKEQVRKRLPGERPLAASRITRDGLKAGTPAPRFSLPDIHGRTVSLDDYRGRRLLLVFSDPRCGPCDEAAAELARFHREHSGNGLDLVMVGRGEIGENRKKAEDQGIRFPVVVQDKWRLSKEYGIFSTPVAFLVDENGVIVRDVAAGSGAIMALAREGLKAGKERNHEQPYR